MAQNIRNTAQLSIDNNPLQETCPVITRVEPGLKVQKIGTTDQGRVIDSGTVGQSRRVTYDILLTNYSSVPFTNVIITDTIETEPEIDPKLISYISDASKFTNSGELPEIILNVGTVPAESQMIVYYTIQFADTVPINTKITNLALADYTENTLVDAETQEPIPVPSNPIEITISYSETTIDSNKTGPEHVLCGENFDYVLTFENTGLNVATNVSVIDNLPDGFKINSVVVENGTKELIRNTDYEYTDDANPLIIKSIGNALDIAVDSVLTVTINGYISCN